MTLDNDKEYTAEELKQKVDEGEITFATGLKQLIKQNKEEMPE